jgi:O-antigen/teichoic acid export membrane protein
MTNIRRGIVWAFTGQNLNLAINFATLVVLARLLTPAEYGVASLSLAIIGVAEAFRELAGGSFIIREHDLTADKIRTTTTVNILVTAAVSALLLLAAGPLSRLFDAPLLAPFLAVAVAGYSLATFLYPQQALMGREMAFSSLAMVQVISAVAGALLSIALAFMGAGALSLAWGGVLSTATATALCLGIRRDLSIYKPSLSQWRRVFAFGAYSSAAAVLSRIADAVPVLIFGRFLSAEALSFGHRSILLCQLPEKAIQAAVGVVALPEFSRQAREGRDLKSAYLGALSHMTVAHWPAMTLMALLARPIVHVVLGGQWLEVASLIPILGPALMLGLPLSIQYPALAATDGVRLLPRLVLAQTLVLTAVLWIATRHGLEAASFGALLAMAINGAMSILAVRSRIAFRWAELFAVLSRSVAVSACTAAGPLVLAFASPPGMPLPIAAVAALTGAAGWAAGLFATGHPLRNELSRAAATLLRSPRLNARGSSEK